MGQLVEMTDDKIRDRQIVRQKQKRRTPGLTEYLSDRDAKNTEEKGRGMGDRKSVV